MAEEAPPAGAPARDGDEAIKRRLYLLHSATGHGSVKHLIEALRKRGASERVLQLASEFRCPVCIEKQRVGSRPTATLEPLPLNSPQSPRTWDTGDIQVQERWFNFCW